jgi:hypothetical protein
MITKINLQVLSIISLMLFMVACQKEEQQFIDDTNNQDTFTAGSNLTQILLSASQNNGSLDNIIDGSDCISVVYPVQVVANGQQVTLQSINDLSLVEAIFNQFPNDTDALEIIFPITVATEDFEQIIVENQTALDALIANCSNAIADTYSCVDFVYPITCFIYNEANEQTNTITLNNSYEWFEYLIYLQPGIYVAIDYPMSVIVNGQTIVVNSNQELSAAIAQADCNSGGTSSSEFETIITTGVWYVTYYFDDFDETGDFADYEFNFATDGTAGATNTAGTTLGTWNYYVDSNVDKVDLYFGTVSPLDELDEDWEILEATQDMIRLRHESGDGSLDYVTYERDPYTGGGGNVNPFITELTSGTWFVNYMEDSGTEETCDYVAYEFLFDINGTVSATSATTTKNGFWSAIDDSGTINLILNFDLDGTNDPFEDLNDDWDVQDYTSLSIQMLDVSGGGGGTDYLNFGRDPFTGCGGGGNELSDILLNGPWYVASYLDNGGDETYYYYGYNLTFNSDGTVVAENGVNSFNGTWSVAGTPASNLVLDFGTQIPFDEFNDNWDVLSYNATTINLEDVSGGGGGTDTLIFQKI